MDASTEIDKGTNLMDLCRPQSNISNLSSGIDLNLLSSAKATVIFKCVVMSTIGVVGFFGDILTLTAIRTTPALRTRPNRLIAALSAWQLFLQGPLSVVFNTYQILAFIVSGQPCRYRVLLAVMTPIQKLPFYAGNTLFVAIAVDRYIAVVYPLHYDAVVTETRINYAIGASSLVAGAVLIVQLLWLVNISWSSCDIPYSITMHYAFDLVFYIFGASLLVFVYGRIFLIALEHRRRIDQSPVLRSTVPSGGISVIEQSSTMNTAQQTESQSGRTKSTKSQLRAARMTGIVIGSYSISWLPYFIGKGLQFSGNRAQYVQNLIDVGSALGTTSVCLNWVIYGMTSRIFRKAFLRILCKRHKRVVENSRPIRHN